MAKYKVTYSCGHEGTVELFRTQANGMGQYTESLVTSKSISTTRK